MHQSKWESGITAKDKEKITIMRMEQVKEMLHQDTVAVALLVVSCAGKTGLLHAASALLEFLETFPSLRESLCCEIVSWVSRFTAIVLTYQLRASTISSHRPY